MTTTYSVRSKITQAALALIAVAMATLLMPAFAFAEAGKRSKAIDFDDEVVEGMNRRPLDSLSQISERNKKRRKPHLYRKRAGFRPETAETLKVMRYTQ